MLLKEKFTSSIADISAMIAEISAIEDINLIANTSVITAVTKVINAVFMDVFAIRFMSSIADISAILAEI